MADKPYTTRDGFGPLTKGMHSGLDPLLLDSNGQYYYGVNITTRGGFAKTRPGFVSLGKIGTGLFQGAISYLGLNQDYLVFAIGGKVYGRRLNGTIDEVDGTLSATAERIYLSQVDDKVVAQDGTSRPIVVEAPAGVFVRRERDVVRDPGCAEPKICLVPGTIGVYAHGRYHYVPTGVPLYEPSTVDGDNEDVLPTLAGWPNNGKCFISTDVNDPTMDFPALRLSEHRVLNEGGNYELPAGLGTIHGMGVMRGASTGTGYGELYVFGTRGVSAFSVGGPRASNSTNQVKGWKDIQFSQVAYFGAGTFSPLSIININDDLWYLDSDKYLRSVGYDTTQLSNGGYSSPVQSNTTKSFETQRWVDATSYAYRGNVSLAYAGNRLLWNMCNGNGLCSIDFAQTYSANPAEIPILHEGIWTGFKFLQVLTISGILHAIVSDGDDIHLLMLSDDVDDPGGTPIESQLVTKFYTGYYNEQTWLQKNKQLESVELLLSGISRDTLLSVWFRPDHYSGWTLLGEKQFSVPAGSAPQVRTDVLFSVNSSKFLGCNPATKTSLRVGRAFQFKLVWTGRMQINSFFARMPMVDDAPRPQCAEDNPSAAGYPADSSDDFSYEAHL